MPLDVSDARNPSEQVAAKLRQAIEQGIYKPAERLPTGTQLASEYGVARGTVLRALDILRAERRVQSWQGKGTYVRDTADVALESLPDTLSPEYVALRHRLDDIEAKVVNLTRRVSEIGHGPATSQTEFAELRQSIGYLEAQLINLYHRVGQPYPHGGEKDAGKPARRTEAAGG